MPSFQENFTAWSDVFLVHLSTRYRIEVSKLRADWQSFVAGTLEPLGDACKTVDPKNTSKTIASLQVLGDEESADEIKTRVTNPDDNSEAADDAVPSSNVGAAATTSQQQASAATVENDGSSSSDDEDDVLVDDETPPQQPTTKKTKAPDAPKKKSGKKDESSSSSEEVVAEGSSSDDESEPPEPIVAKKGKKAATKAAPAPKGKKQAAPKKQPKKVPTPEASEEEEETSGSGSQDSGSTEEEDIVVESEEEAPKGTDVGKKGKAPAPKGKTKAVALVLSDTPKLAVADRPTIPKGMKFVKGTNYVVFEGTVVAACTKKGIVQLTTVNTKALDNKGTTYDTWTNDKIKKTKKWVM